MFGARLLNILSGMDIGLLARDVHSRAEFVDALRGLSEVINTLKVDDSLLPPDAGKKVSGSLRRIEAAVQHRLRGKLDDPVMASAIADLRSVTKLDSAYSHNTGGLPSLWPMFGMTNPPASWDVAWNAVRARTLSAVRRLVGRVRALVNQMTFGLRCGGGARFR